MPQAAPSGAAGWPVHEPTGRFGERFLYAEALIGNGESRGPRDAERGPRGRRPRMVRPALHEEHSVTNPAIFASAFAPHLGGVEELVRQLAVEQRLRGARTVVVTNRWPRALDARETVDGIPVLREALRFPGSGWRSWAGFLADSRAVSRRLLHELRSAGTDLVHVQCVSNNGLYALRAARQLGVPLVVTMQGELTMDADRIYEHNPYLRHVWRRVLDAADVITACSDFSLREAEQVYGKPFGDRARVIYNGIRLAEFERLEPERRDRPYVLGLGRMVRQKGMDLLLEAYAGLDTECDLVLAGDGPVRPDLEAQAASLGVRDRVHFLGGVDHRRALALFAGAEVFVLPSRHEPQGIVLLEALAAGTPVLAARVGGVPEVVHDGETGALFEGGNAIDLRRRLNQLLAEPDLRRTLRARGPTHAKNFSWAAIADEYEDCYEKATAAART